MTRPAVLVVGAGVAGLAAARRLRRAGVPVLVVDKGRGVGGRCATRRVQASAGALQFDHGAQYLTAEQPAFASVLAGLRATGAVGDWALGGQGTRAVGVPGMSGLARALAEGLELRQSVEVTGLKRLDGGWTLTSTVGDFEAARVVLCVPAPQLAALPGIESALATEAATVTMLPCLTLMAAFPAEAPAPFQCLRDPGAPLAWIAEDSSKPGRARHVRTWVAQAGAAWSAAHLDDEREALRARMLALLCGRLGTEARQALYSTVHRWRYAHSETPLGKPFLCSADGTLYAGGDWCLGGRIESAWASGEALATAMLERGHVG